MRLASLIAVAVAVLPQGKPSWEEIVARGQKNVDRLRELRSALPRAEFDGVELGKSFAGDVGRAAEFVRTKIAHEPYRGFLKGAQGALVSRRANAADRALLLATLLAGREPRIVKGTLPADKQPAAALGVREARPADEKAVAARLGVDLEKLKKRSEAAALRAQESHDALWARVDRDLEAVAAALQGAGIAPPAAAASAIEETWWVRLGEKDLGRPEGAQEVSVHSLAEIPQENFHRLTLRMKIAQNDKEVPVLDVSIHTASLFGRTLTIGNVAADNPDRLNKVSSRKSKDWFDAVAATTTFIPLLTGVEKPITGKPFDLSGNTLPVRNGVIQKLQGALDLFDALPGGDAEKKELTACWLEVVRTAPGEEPSAAKRTIFKKGAKGRQRVFDLLASREILVLSGDLSADFALDLVLESDIAARDALLKQMTKPTVVAAKLPSRVNPKLYQFGLARASALRELATRKPGAVPAVPGASLVSFVYRILDGKPVTGRAGFDILSNPLEASGAKPAAWKDSLALAAGILDTALEHEVHKTKGAHANTSVQLEKALIDKRALAVAKGDGRIRVTVPGAPASWYEVDAKSGGCLGYVDEGGGQDMTEYAILVADKLEEIREWQAHAELLNAALDCCMSAMDSNDAERAFALCMAQVAIGEAFGWAAGGIIGGAAGALDSPWARLGGMALEDFLNSTLSDAMDGAGSGGR